MASRRRVFIVFAVVIGLLLIALAVIAGISNSSKPDFLTAPNPNGFELLTAAASEVQGVEPFRGSRGISTRAYLEQNAESLKLMREAIHHSAELPEKFYSLKNSAVGDVQAIRRLGGIANLQAAQYQDEGNADAAADLYLDLVRLGHRVQRGTMVCVLIGIAIEKQGLDGLNAVGPLLRSDKRQNLAAQLAELRKTAMTLNDVRERELYYFRKNVPFGAAFAHLLPRFKNGMVAIQPKLARIRQDLDETHLKLKAP